MTEKRGPGRPATGQTPVRTLRVGLVWDEAKAIADVRGEKMAAVVEEALRRYISRHRVGGLPEHLRRTGSGTLDR